MELPFDVARFLGAWRWLVATDSVILGEELALLLGIEPAEGRVGVKSERVARAIHPDDQRPFFEAIERASHYGGDIHLSYRVMADGVLHRIESSGSCVRTQRGGRPSEYLGAAHVREERDEHPLTAAADHLLAAAQLVRSTGDKPLSYFIDMALTEMGARLAERTWQGARPRIALVRRVV